tara:strand:- start:8151 stop:8282 length:132 start_codon:yes stop_codon:yes gene_type:complete
MFRKQEIINGAEMLEAFSFVSGILIAVAWLYGYIVEQEMSQPT